MSGAELVMILRVAMTCSTCISAVCGAELVMMLRVVRSSTCCSVVGVQCRAGDDVEGGQVFHLFGCWCVVQNW